MHIDTALQLFSADELMKPGKEFLIFGMVPKLASVPCFDFPFNLLCQGKIELVSGCGEGNVLYTVQAYRRLLVFQAMIVVCNDDLFFGAAAIH